MKKETIEHKATRSEGKEIEVGSKTPTRKLVKTGGKVETCSGIIWSYMTKEHGFTGEQLLQLRQAMIPAKVRGKPGTLVRVFAPTSSEARGVTVQDFNSLNEHPELILYEGYYYGRGGTGEIVIEKRTGTGPSLLDRKLQDGSITEVGMKEEDSAAKKWLGRIGTFMIMGGWLLTVILVVGIVIAVSVLTKGC